MRLLLLLLLLPGRHCCHLVMQPMRYKNLNRSSGSNTRINTRSRLQSQSSSRPLLHKCEVRGPSSRHWFRAQPPTISTLTLKNWGEQCAHCHPCEASKDTLHQAGCDRACWVFITVS